MRCLPALLSFLLAVMVLLPLSAEAAGRWGVNDPRYAALVMDPRTGEVFHQANADAQRYPASLTKMMTLYLLFEALERGKVRMNTPLPVSKYAATMPQTNLYLRAGEKIPVETAIKALVVRSANDVAVVVGEYLGGDVNRFGVQMTNKARALGMRSTVFKNPNGLPNGAQHTTARDMAKLGIALKRDFPRYYRYFAVRQFSWKGQTYYTHNRVMLRYSGTDGIKTGFINASGFNVVSSVTRGGRSLVGVVMGGGSGQWRDDRMIALFNEAYKVIAKRGQGRGTEASGNLPNSSQGAAPRPAKKIPALGGGKAKKMPSPVPEIVRPSPVSVPPVAPITPETMLGVSTRSAPPAVAVVRPAPVVSTTPRSTVAMTLDDQLAQRNSQAVRVALRAAEPVVTDVGQWGIQVGAFSSYALAEQAARFAYQRASASLQGAQLAVAGSGKVYRARLNNLSEAHARKACQALIAANTPCFIYNAR